MRRPLIAGNWKMNMARASAVALAEGVVKRPRASIASIWPFARRVATSTPWAAPLPARRSLWCPEYVL